MPYVGRFAPSPTGLLHAGSVVAALASYLDARCHQGRWLVRLEDVDTTRCKTEWGHGILQQLHALGLHHDGEVVWQSQRSDVYQHALDQLIQKGWAYPCGCSRKSIEQAQREAGIVRERHQDIVYPGTCRNGYHGTSPVAWRLHVQRVIDDLQMSTPLRWYDRRLGWQQQDVAQQVGDFVLRRADGVWAYQMAVVVDDALQHVTHVVRGEDLHDNTARQVLLQRALALPAVNYCHTPLVLSEDGEKLSKQNGAQAIDTAQALGVLSDAAHALGLPRATDLSSDTWAMWQHAWGLAFKIEA